MIDRSIAPEIQPVRAVQLERAQQEPLANGMPLYCLSGGDQEVIQMELVFPGGRYQELKPLTAQLAARLLREGTHARSAAEIAEIVDFHGAHLEAGAAYDNALLTLVTLKKHLPALLPLVHEILTQPLFAEEELTTQKQRSLQQLLVNQEKTDYLAQRLFHEKTFGEEHPYGYASSKEKYEAIQSSDLREFYQSTKGLNYGLVAGKVDTETIQLLDQHLGNLSRAEETARNSKPIIPSPGKYHQEKAGAQQSSIRIGKPMINLGHPDYAELQVLNTLLGGYFGSRLMSNIREDKGFTYGIYSSLGAFKHTGYWMIGTEVGKDVASQALEEIYKELSILSTELVSEDELELVKNYIMGSYLSRVDGPFAQAKVHKSLINHGQTTQDFQGRIQKVLDTNPKRIQELAQKYYNREGLIEVVVG